MENLSLIEISALLKNKRVLLVLSAILVVVVVGGWYFSTHHATPTWRGLKPGSSTEMEVKTILGQPLRTGKEGSYSIYGYKVSASELLDEVWLKDNKVLLVKEQVSYDPNFTKENLKKYGKPKVLYSEEFAQAQELEVFTDWGQAFLINKNKGTIEQIWYFETTTYEKFKANFGTKLLEEKPVDTH